MESCIFCKIVSGEIPSRLVLENERFYAFHDIQPVSPVHVLVIPKHHVANIAEISDEDAAAMEGFFTFIRDVARELGVAETGYRVIVNTGAEAGQTVYHLHAHILAGETMSWPPK